MLSDVGFALKQSGLVGEAVEWFGEREDLGEPVCSELINVKAVEHMKACYI
jgi:hypothetical protein